MHLRRFRLNSQTDKYAHTKFEIKLNAPPFQ